MTTSPASQQNELKLGREVGQRTDTMMVLHLSEDHTKVTVVSLPRDTWTTIPGQGRTRSTPPTSSAARSSTVQTVSTPPG